MRDKILAEFQALDRALLAMGFSSIIQEQPNGAILFVCGPLDCTILAPPDIHEIYLLVAIREAIGHLFGSAMLFFAVHHGIAPRIPEQIEPLHALQHSLYERIQYLRTQRRIEELDKVGQ